MSIFRQGAYFVLVGGALVCVDWLTFVALSAFGMTAVFANIAGRFVGALFGFALNGVITFGQFRAPRLGLRRFSRYGVLWAGLTVVSTVLVTLLADRMGLRTAWAAKPVVEIAMATLSFFISRHWVYR